MRPASLLFPFFRSPKALRCLLAVCCLAGPALFIMLGAPSIGNPLTPGETITAGDLTLSLNAEGRITGLYEGDTGGANRRANGRSTPLLSLVVEDSPDVPVSTGTEVHYRPQSRRYTTRTAGTGETARGRYLFRFADRIEVTVEVVQKPGYATLEVTAIANPEDKDIRLLLWGPLATDITAHVGETVGVVSDRDFGIGLIGVNARTLGGWPQQYPQTGLEAEAVGGAGQGGACRHGFAVCAALPATFGSMLQAYTRDYSVERVFKPWSAGGVEGPLPVASLAGEQAAHGQLVGSKVALFGVARRATVAGDESLRDVMDAAVLARIGAIGSGEELPHPIVSKVWGKQAEQANAPYLVFTDLSSANLDRALTLANDLGWQTVYRNTGWGAFDDGSLGVGSDFGGTDAGLRAAAQRAADRRVGLGSHSRFGAIPGSLAARHAADLLVTHYGVLDAELSVAATTLRLKPYPGATPEALLDAFPAAGVVRIGEELIAYGSVSSEPQDILALAGLLRAHEGTVAAVHAAGARAGLLGRPAGQTGYLAGLGLLQDVLAPRLVTRLNQGISNFTFDGSEHLTWSGYGALGQNLVLEQVWRGLTDREDFVHGAATALPYTWHLNTRYDWGVSAPDAVADDVHYQRANQVYFRRNYLPPMMGWWRLESANEWRRAQAQGAAFGAGFAWFGSVAEAGRLGATLRGEIRDWRNAQLAGTFDRQSRFLMQAQDDYFRLDKVEHARGIGPTWRLSDWAPSGAAGGRRSNSRYLAPQLRGFPLVNLARDATVTASGSLDSSRNGSLAVDTHAGVGAVAGEAGLSGVGEWAIAAAAPEKWIELAWDSPQKIRRIILFDRAQTDQNVSAGALTFTHADDSTTTQAVTGISADGSPRIVDFTQKTVNKVRFTITASNGAQPGLAEFVALGPNPHYQAGTLAEGAAVTGVAGGHAGRVTDGVIGAGTDTFATLAGNHAVLDLGGQYYLNGLAVWHYFDDARTYRDVVFEVADNPEFNNSTIVFNNDTDNSLGLGAGTDAEYPESSAGKQVLFAPLPGRYVRLWSGGNSVNDANHLAEVEVYGTGNGTTDVADAGVTSGDAAAIGLGNAIDHDPATQASVGTGAQYLQLDLGREKRVNSLLVLRDNANMRTYRGVVYQLSTTADFSADVTTVFHNDNDDLHGLGLGASTDTAYQETANGRYVRFAPLTARYVRLYSAGSNYDNTNRYREVLVGTAQAGTAAPSARQVPATAFGSSNGGALARSVATTVMLQAAPAPATRATTPGTRQLSTRQQSSTTLSAGDLTITLDAMGVVTGLTDPGDTDHNVAAHPTTLVSLVVEDAATDAPSSGTGAHYKPTGWSYAAGTAGTGESARGEYTFSFADNISAAVTAVEKPGYATLELTGLGNPDGKDIRLVLWGPLTTDIDENIGDLVGVVSERDFAIGLFGTNAKTRGGWPQQYEAAGFESLEVGGHIDYPDRWRARVCRNNFEVCAAAPMTFGTIVQAFTRDYTVERVFDPWSIARRYQPRPIPPLTGDLAEHGKLIGSKVAVFGVARSGSATGDASLRDVRDAEVLDRIGAVEVGEGMPHPIIGKVWGKKSEKANAPYFIFTDLNTSRMAQALQLANDIGWRGIYRNGTWGVFDNGAMTSVSSNFGGNDAGLTAAVNRAKAKHVSFGTHSLFSFVPGSTGGADPTGLTVLYYGELVNSITTGASSLTVRPLAGTTGAHLRSRFDRSDARQFVIGNELIRRGSRAVSGDTVVLSSLSRGRSGTTAAAHASGVRVGVLGKPPYSGEYVAGLRMMYDTLAPRLVQKLDLGITGFSYDGSEWITWTEYADLGQNLVMEKVFDDLADNEDFVHDAANALPYTWHINSRYNWGETADNILEAQQRRRWATQVFFKRNFMLPQLGWWNIDNANEWRWALSKAAAFDAGFAYFGGASDQSRYGATLRSKSATGTTPPWPGRSTGRTGSSCRRRTTTSGWTRCNTPGPWVRPGSCPTGPSPAPRAAAAATAATWRRSCAAFRWPTWRATPG